MILLVFLASVATASLILVFGLSFLSKGQFESLSTGVAIFGIVVSVALWGLTKIRNRQGQDHPSGTLQSADET